MAAPLGTLDAIHLATGEMWREARGTELVMATHDTALALAARATGFRVVGVQSCQAPRGHDGHPVVTKPKTFCHNDLAQLPPLAFPPVRRLYFTLIIPPSP